MLAGRSLRAACRRGDPFFFERRDGVLVYERVLSVHVKILSSFIDVSLVACVYLVHSGTVCIHR